MLAGLAIRDIVLIDRLEVAFEPGLSVLTGETGAGKSILLDSLALALGARGDAALVRAGASQGQVTAAFDVAPGHPVRALLAEAGIDSAGEPVILRRVQSADGRTRAYVNDQPVSAQALRAAGHALVEIHGQHDERALTDPAAHRALLDAYGGLGPAADGVRVAWRRWRDAARERDAAVAKLEDIRREADYLRHAHAELSKLAPEPDEEEALAAARTAMMAAEKIGEELRDAYAMLDGATSPIPTIAGLSRRLERKQAALPGYLPAVAAALGRALDALEEARSGLQAALRASEHDPKALERAEERLFALRAAARKYAVPAAALAPLAQRFEAELGALDQGEQRLAGLAAAAASAESAYRARAGALSVARGEAAARLDGAVGAELPPLKLDGARFLTRVERNDGVPGPDGVDQVAFWVQTNPGTPAGPLMKVASGGELARFVLALKVVLADTGGAPTLVFDEIDSGVGGAVADAIGQRLARLAERVQVLAVTHAPQVAARAGGHFQILKEPTTEGRVATRLSALEQGARREEVARMLSGARITDEARAQAARLMGVGGE